MSGEWEAHTDLRSGLSKIDFADGTSLTVQADGSEGFAFVDEFLAEMGRDYPSHLKAADMKLQQRLGKAYRVVRNLPRRYKAELALVSLNCCFGREDEVPDHGCDGRFNMEFTLCPERYCCPFNGFNPSLRERKTVCCNPVYECGLTPVQTRVASLMVDTPLSYESIAQEMGCSYSNVDNLRKRIFSCLGVSTRSELAFRLRGKRLL